MQKIIATKKVAVVGCGGIGNLVAALLATAGIKELILFDKDHIELSNLNRQYMFTEKDCGKFKTEILAKAIRERSSHTKVTEVREFINDSNIHLLEGFDFILVSGDQDELLDQINVFAVEKGIPIMSIGYIEDIAVWGPLVIPGKSGCCQCKQHIVNFESLTSDQISKCKAINNRYQTPANGPISMMASSFAALDILRLFGNFGQIQSLNTRIGIWSHDLHIEKQDYTLNPACEVCGLLQKTMP